MVVDETQALAVHGFATIPWEHRSIPQRAWDQLRPLPSGCWVAKDERTGRILGGTMVERLLRRNPMEAWAITPTCGHAYCANPAHLCVTFANATSKEDLDGNRPR